MQLYYQDNPYISGFSDYAVYATARLGDNGADWGMGEQGVGGSQPELWGMQQWDDNPDDGIAAEGITFELRVTSNGTTSQVSWTIGNQVVTYEVGLANVGDVILQAGVTTGGTAFNFDRVNVSYRDNGQETEWANLSTFFGADTREEGWVQEKVAVVDTQTPHDEVVITGLLSVHVAEGTWAGGGDVFGNIMIYDT